MHLCARLLQFSLPIHFSFGPRRTEILQKLVLCCVHSTFTLFMRIFRFVLFLFCYVCYVRASVCREIRNNSLLFRLIDLFIER